MQATKSELVDYLRHNDLMRSALLVGQIQDMAFKSQRYIDSILDMAGTAWELMGESKEDASLTAEAIAKAIFDDYGLEGKSEKYKQVIDDPHRYYPHSVLERKIASPLALTIIYCSIAEQLGVTYECLALPSYYLIRLQDKRNEYYIDAFDNGRILTTEEFQKKFRSALQKNRMISTNLFEKVNAQHLVARLVQQLKHIYILKGNAVEALRSVELLTAMFPENPELNRDRGILYCEMEYFSKAMDDLKYYLQMRPQAEDVAEIKKLTGMLKGYREIVN